MRRWTPLLVLVLLTGVLWTDFSVFAHGEWLLRHTIGLAIVVPASAGWATARYQLGSAFTPRAEARALVTRGLYSRIRHPIYLFAEVLIAGLLVFLGHPILLVASLALVPLQVARARREERILEEAFGERYRDYRRMTWF